ncbi:MAG: fasciclin domain-containing protein [Verrucomicrobiae bacterium]|nr:fasciclin domain-containing protein [Verrucomicrobiae bacterium]MCP5545915.1 fasciclin domain-containing protein [Akkermansiaceae bacterium]
MKLSKYALALLAASTPMILAEETTTEAAESTMTAEKQTQQEKKTGTIADVIRDSPNFSILEKAVKAAGLTETLDEATVRTVFAPTDEAFQKLPEGTLGKLLLPENKEKLRSLLLYHVVNGDVLTMSLRDATEVKSVSGDKLDIEIGDDTKEVNDAKIVNTTITDTNGVILVTDQVLVPESLDGFADLED